MSKFDDICNVICSVEDEKQLAARLEEVDCSSLSAEEVRRLIVEAYEEGFDAGGEDGWERGMNYGASHGR